LLELGYRGAWNKVLSTVPYLKVCFLGLVTVTLTIFVYFPKINTLVLFCSQVQSKTIW